MFRGSHATLSSLRRLSRTTESSCLTLTATRAWRWASMLSGVTWRSTAPLWPRRRAWGRGWPWSMRSGTMCVSRPHSGRHGCRLLSLRWVQITNQRPALRSSDLPQPIRGHESNQPSNDSSKQFSKSIFRMESFTRQSWSCSSGLTTPPPPSGRQSQWTSLCPALCSRPNIQSSWNCWRIFTDVSPGWCHCRRLLTSLSFR